jgi:hypothetical protein
VLVKRCAEGAPTREAFMARVLAQMVDRVDTKVVEAELWRIMS